VLLKEKIIQYFGEDLFSSRLTILDLGCGFRFPSPSLFAAEGHKAIGVDSLYIVRKPDIREYLRSLRRNKLVETLRFLQLDLMAKRRLYERSLENLSHLVLTHSNFELVVDDVEQLANFSDNSMDLVVSTNVLEHVFTVNKAVEQIYRVLGPGGITAHIIHLFSSLSGSHNPEWQNFARYPAWDHLRSGKFSLPYSHLNRLKTIDYLNAFSNHFSVVHHEYIPYPMSLDYSIDSHILAEIRASFGPVTLDDLVNEKLLVLAAK